jgi:hypothetical protein
VLYLPLRQVLLPPEALQFVPADTNSQICVRQARPYPPHPDESLMPADERHMNKKFGLDSDRDA